MKSNVMSEQKPEEGTDGKDSLYNCFESKNLHEMVSQILPVRVQE